MKRGRQLGVLCLVLISTACGTKRPPQTVSTPAASPGTVEPAPPAPPLPSPAAIPAAVGESEDDVFARKTLEQLNSEQPLGHVFFNVDQATLRDSDRTVLQRNADWLRRWAGTRIVVEGHCDERGTPEYNLALGDRRAAVVRDYLMGLGVPPERVSTLSKGKEQPFCQGATEDCWQRNRRGHFLVVAK